LLSLLFLKSEARSLPLSLLFRKPGAGSPEPAADVVVVTREPEVRNPEPVVVVVPEA